MFSGSRGKDPCSELTGKTNHIDKLCSVENQPWVSTLTCIMHKHMCGHAYLHVYMLHMHTKQKRKIIRMRGFVWRVSAVHLCAAGSCPFMCARKMVNMKSRGHGKGDRIPRALEGLDHTAECRN